MEILHDIAAGRFYHQTSQGIECNLYYLREDSKLLEICAVDVPESVRKSGIGLELIMAAKEYAQKHNYIIIPHCGYAKKVLEEK